MFTNYSDVPQDNKANKRYANKTTWQFWCFPNTNSTNYWTSIDPFKSYHNVSILLHQDPQIYQLQWLIGSNYRENIKVW